MKLGLGLCALLLVAACERPAQTPDAPAQPPEPNVGPSVATTSSVVPAGSVPPAWLGTRQLPKAANGLGEIQPTPPELRNRRFTLPDRLPQVRGVDFGYDAVPAPDDVVARSSWTPACPVARKDLRWVRLTFWGFDDRRHTGELLVNQDAVGAITDAFEQLYAAKYPIEEMRITRADELDAAPTGDGNNTSAFTCKPLRGTTTWSEHAKGRAIDINPFDNPYLKDDVLIPELASAYADRSRQAPGMIHAGDAVTKAFSSVGWGWGGAWQHSKDYMHFSANSR